MSYWRFAAMIATSTSVMFGPPAAAAIRRHAPCRGRRDRHRRAGSRRRTARPAEGDLGVTGHTCSRHPAAPAFHGHCPACLFEAACGLPQQTPAATGGRLTIQVPLGEGEAASVFLVRDDSATPRLFRLKRWRTPAPVGFIEGFDRLKARLEAWRTPAIVLPVTAWVDETGCPSVVTDFRQGMPLLESIKSGWLRRERADLALRQLRETIDAAHARGLAHGSVVAGNVFSARPDGAPYLLDFGLAGLFSPPGEAADRVAADLEGLASIQAQFERLTASRADSL